MPRDDRQPKVLVSALNWGLGHATRCIPIIRELMSQGAEVVLASDGRAYGLLHSEFPDLKIYELPAYDISYVTEKMALNITAQLPRILMAIFREHKAILKIINTEDIHGVISDNRFGCFHPKIHSVFITHQLNIKVPLKPLEMFTRMINRRVIDKFHECWIPDFQGRENLSGELSVPKKMKNVSFIGPVTRFTSEPATKKYDIAVLLSGPEPQRTTLENIILKQAKGLGLKLVIVQGKTESNERIMLGDIEVIAHLRAKELNELILASDIIISRSGYTTIMDLVALKKKAILIPTPGQTEQEYLAESFHKRNVFLAVKQKNFDLKDALTRIDAFDPEFFIYGEHTPLKETISGFLDKISIRS